MRWKQLDKCARPTGPQTWRADDALFSVLATRVTLWDRGSAATGWLLQCGEHSLSLSNVPTAEALRTAEAWVANLAKDHFDRYCEAQQAIRDALGTVVNTLRDLNEVG